MKYLFGFVIFTVLHPFLSMACDFKPLIPTIDKKNGGVYFQIDQKRSLFFESVLEEESAVTFPGLPVIMVNGKKLCTIKGNVFTSKLFIDSQKSLLMTNELSGSVSYSQIINLKNCHHVGPKIEYVGNLELKGDHYVAKPSCEPIIEGASCSSGLVYSLTSKCSFKLDKKASRKLTKSELGVELPAFGIAYRVKNPHTPSAELLK